MKNETIESHLKNQLEVIHCSCRSFDFDLGFKTGGVIGAKWQQERSYSEGEFDELISLLKTTTEYEASFKFRLKVEQFEKTEK